MLIDKIFNIVKSKIPKISNTELIALRSGNTSIDRNILQGKLVFPNKPVLSSNNLDKFKSSTDYILNHFDNKQIYPNTNNNYWINYLAKNE